IKITDQAHGSKLDPTAAVSQNAVATGAVTRTTRPTQQDNSNIHFTSASLKLSGGVHDGDVWNVRINGSDNSYVAGDAIAGCSGDLPPLNAVAAGWPAAIRQTASLSGFTVAATTDTLTISTTATAGFTVEFEVTTSDATPAAEISGTPLTTEVADA